MLSGFACYYIIKKENGGSVQAKSYLLFTFWKLIDPCRLTFDSPIHRVNLCLCYIYSEIGSRVSGKTLLPPRAQQFRNIQSLPQSSHTYKTGRAPNEPTIPTIETKGNQVVYFIFYSSSMGDVILSHKYCSKTDLEEESWKKHTKERPAMSSLGHFLWRPQLTALRCV